MQQQFVRFAWLAAAELISGKALLFGLPGAALPRADWQGSVTGAVGDALGPLLTSPAMAVVLAWAVFAAVLPLLVRGRVLAFDLVGAGVWAAGLVAASLGDLRGAVAGPLLAAGLQFIVHPCRHLGAGSRDQRRASAAGSLAPWYRRLAPAAGGRRYLATIAAVTAQRDAIAGQMKSVLDAAAFGNQPVGERQERLLTGQGELVIEAVERLAGDHDDHGHEHHGE